MELFNALKYTQELEKVGFSREQAEKSVSILIEVMENNLATKSDIQIILQRINESELKMTIRLGSILVISLGAFTTMLKLL